MKICISTPVQNPIYSYLSTPSHHHMPSSMSSTIKPLVAYTIICVCVCPDINSDLSTLFFIKPNNLSYLAIINHILFKFVVCVRTMLWMCVASVGRFREVFLYRFYIFECDDLKAMSLCSFSTHYLP